MAIGNTVATVTTLGGSPWASYRFMGITTYNAKPVAVLDLMRVIPGDEDRGPIVVGFLLTDLSTALPKLLVFDAGSHIRSEQIGCGT
jgi:hypothetical protein